MAPRQRRNALQTAIRLSVYELDVGEFSPERDNYENTTFMPGFGERGILGLRADCIDHDCHSIEWHLKRACPGQRSHVRGRQRTERLLQGRYLRNQKRQSDR